MEITIGSAKSFSHKVDLIDGDAGEIVQALATKVTLRFQMLWHFCVNKDQVNGDQDEFDKGLSGDVLKKAVEALWEEIVFFTQSLRPEVGEAVMLLLEKYDVVINLQTQEIRRVLESGILEKQYRMEADKMMDRITGELSGKLPDGSVLTPGH